VSEPILYCGDTSLDGAASYLAGLLTLFERSFEYVRSDQPLEAAAVTGRDLIILSDYPAAQLQPGTDDALLTVVDRGTSLLMIGGWESFHGLGGDWDKTTLAAALPVEIQTSDDRLNCDHPVLLRRISAHPAIDGLPWEQRPPGVGGLNRFTPKAEATVLLEGDRLRPKRDQGDWKWELQETHAMLVVGEQGSGRTAALATDVAPHWVGGFVDWGDGRVDAQAEGAEGIEVGDLYACFWRQLLSFLIGHQV
jgi:uncharacterized membrane protein